MGHKIGLGWIDGSSSMRRLFYLSHASLVPCFYIFFNEATKSDLNPPPPSLSIYLVSSLLISLPQSSLSTDGHDRSELARSTMLLYAVMTEAPCEGLPSRGRHSSCSQAPPWIAELHRGRVQPPRAPRPCVMKKHDQAVSHDPIDT